MRLRFTFRQLEYLVAVGEAGTIALASQRINVSSPSISSAVSQLEAEFGTQLFVRRHAHGLTLTPGGQRIFDEAKQILFAANALNDLANDITDLPRGPISIGCLATMAPIVSAFVRKSFQAAYPEAIASSREANQLELFHMLGRAEIDVAITYDLEIPKDTVFDPLVSLPLYVMLPFDHPFAQRDSVSIEELSNEPMILLDIPMSREYFLSAFYDNDLRPKIAERTNDLSVARSLVANGFGFSLINIRTTTPFAPDGQKLAFCKLEGNHRPMVVGLATKRSEHRSRIVDAFHQHMHERIQIGGLPGMIVDS